MYNFDEIIDRKGTNALNTDGFRGYIFHAGPEKVFPYKDDEFVRMWVADMEFVLPRKSWMSCASALTRPHLRVHGRVYPRLLQLVQQVVQGTL